MNVNRDVRIWVIAFFSALVSYVFASIGFNGIVDFMALGGFTTCFGILMIMATLLEERFLENQFSS